MSRRNKQRRPSPANATATKTSDSFQNLVARVGYQTANQNSASQYGFSPVTRDRVQMEFVYRSSWIAGQAVDTFAQDMTREGVEIKGDLEPDQIELLQRSADRLRLWDAICDTIKWARLYGGCLAVLLIDGQKSETPLRLDTVTEGQFKGLLVLDRWVVQPTLTQLVQELGPEMGKPVFYDVIADSNGLPSQRIHHSRVIRIDGVDLPYWQRIAENGWGQSILERLWDRLIAYDSATQGAAQLIYKAHLRTYKVEGLREILSIGGKAEQGLMKQIEMIRLYQSNEGLTLMDAKDDFEAHQYAFSGLSDMLLQFGEQISGATGIPLTRLLGQSPAGLSSTGESDIRNYYDNVAQEQERRLRTGIGKLYNVLYRSVFGNEPPENFDFDFNPLWQLDDEQKADIATKVATAVVGASDAGLIDRATALKELRQSSRVTSVFTNITDEDIKEAENEPPPVFGEEPPDVETPNAGREAAEKAEESGKGDEG